MAIEFVGAAIADTTGTSFSVAKPTGTAEGDLVLIFCTVAVGTITDPSGFTPYEEDAGAADPYVALWKVAGGSEPANYSFGNTVSTVAQVSAITLRGVDATNPIADSVSALLSGQLSNGVGTTGVTAVEGGAVASFFHNGADAGDLTAPSGFTNRSVDNKIAVADDIDIAAGATGTLTWTRVGFIGSENITFVNVALNPGAAGGLFVGWGIPMGVA